MSSRRVVFHTRAHPALSRWWLRSGWFPGWIIPSTEWTMVVLSVDDAAAPPLAALTRPVPRWLGPCLGWAIEGEQVVVAAHLPVSPRIPHWAAWTPGEGLTQLPGLQALTEDRLLTIAGGAVSDARASMRWELRAACAEPALSPMTATESLFAALRLPGVGFLSGAVPVVPLSDDDVVYPRSGGVRAAAQRWSAALQ